MDDYFVLRYFCPIEENKIKEKITPVFLYRHECEPVDRTLITGFCDAVCGFMPPLERCLLGAVNFVGYVYWFGKYIIL